MHTTSTPRIQRWATLAHVVSLLIPRQRETGQPGVHYKTVMVNVARASRFTPGVTVRQVTHIPNKACESHPNHGPIDQKTTIFNAILVFSDFTSGCVQVTFPTRVNQHPPIHTASQRGHTYVSYDPIPSNPILASTKEALGDAHPTPQIHTASHVGLREAQLIFIDSNTLLKKPHPESMTNLNP